MQAASTCSNASLAVSRLFWGLQALPRLSAAGRRRRNGSSIVSETPLRTYCKVPRAQLAVPTAAAGGAGRYSTLARRTSLMTQFQRVKEQFPDHLLLFQVGDFYELYGTDASEAASKTSLRLTKKAGILMAGFPVRSLDEWQRILVEAGLQLAICNQQPSKRDQSSPTLLEREVVRLVTPGTLTEPLDQSANYLLCVAPGPTSLLGLAWADVSTAEFMVSSVAVADLDEDLERLGPSEVLLPESVADMVQGNLRIGQPHSPMIDGLLKLAHLKECHLTAVPAQWYREKEEEEEGEKRGDHNQMMGPYHPPGYWCVHINAMKDVRFSELERSAVRALLQYIGHTHRHHLLPHLHPPSPFTHSQHMAIDASTRRALELVSPQSSNPKKATLLGCMDGTVTAGGARLLRTRLAAPLTDVDAINRRLDLVELFRLFPLHREALRMRLRSCTDLERTLQKVATMSSSAADLRAIMTTLTTAASIKHYITELLLPETSSATALADLTSGLHDLSELMHELERAVGEPQASHWDYILSGYSPEVDGLREKMKENEAAVHTLATALQSQTGVSKMTVTSYKAYGRVLEVTKAQSGKIEAGRTKLIRIDQTQAKSRYTHVDLQALNAGLYKLESCYIQTQDSLFQHLCDKVMSHADDVTDTAASLARLDVATSLGLLAEERAYTRPTVRRDQVFEVKQGLHPVLASLVSHHHQFVNNDCSMDTHTLWVVTGPNMGGKSTFLRQNALILIMTQMGSFVPATEAVVGVADRLFARVGASDNVARHMSTFHVEMTETANILAMATQRSFVVLDEIGRGTSATEGLALADSVIHYLTHNIGCRCLVATHYQELGGLGDLLRSVGSYKVVAEHDKDGLIFTYKVQPGRAEHSFGIEVAQLAGMPAEVIKRAKEFLQR